jgi:NET1-associated nuclear protein 1 (U3 small nucleolar RNA-associated protein 17)
VPIVPRTNVSVKNSRDGSTGPTTLVTHVAFSKDGSVMATVDVRIPEDKIGGGSCLKFWYFSSNNQRFELNTMVDEPHGAEVTALVYHPAEDMIVSCSIDSTFKVWVTTGAGSQERQLAWRCRSVGSYRHKEMYSAAFSPDGSLLGIGTKELVTLWNPHSNGFVTSLACDPSTRKVTHLAFVSESECLIAASAGSKPLLTVWHLPTLSVLWSCLLHVEALSVDPKSSHFGVIALPLPERAELDNGYVGSRKATVTLFSPFNSSPKAAWTMQQGIGATLFFAPYGLLTSSKVKQDAIKSKRDQSSLVVLMPSREYVIFNPYSQDEDMKANFATPAPLPEAVPSGYLTTYGNTSALPNKELKKDVAGIRAVRPWGDLLNASSHVFPSLTRISLTFMESLLEKSAAVEKQPLVGREPEPLAQG